MDKIIVHVDMDCFFCSCEEKKDPTLKGKPVIVGGRNGYGVASAANYEARAFGVFSATPLSKAQKLCPDGIYLNVDFALYKKESKSVMEILKFISDDMEQVSIDEAYLDVTSYAKNFPSLAHMGKAIQKKVLDETSLSCSVGVAASRTVAKIASDFRKPRGIVVVTDAKKFLNPLPIRKIPGIGKVSREHYEQKGLLTIGDLARLDTFLVMDYFGSSGVYFQKIAQGLEIYGISHREVTKSYSNESTFYESLTDTELLIEMLGDLAEKVYSQVDGSYFKTISIKIRYDDFHTITRNITLKTGTSLLSVLRSTAQSLFNIAYSGNPVRLIGIKVTNLLCSSKEQRMLTQFS